LKEALMRFGAPEIFNTDQRSQFTSMAFTAVLHRELIAISMDGCGALSRHFSWRFPQRMKPATLHLATRRAAQLNRATSGRLSS
jgi:putative transposase